MSLPTVTAPTYELKLQSLNKPIKYRPYLVKEEKLLLMAQEGGDEVEIEQTMKDIIHVCTFGVIDPDTLPSFDLELLFLHLRAKSVNNIIELQYECKNVPTRQATTVVEGDDGVCHNKETIKIDLDTIKIVVPPDHTKKIMITEKLGCTMRYPTNKHIQVFKESGSADSVAMIADCIESIFDVSGEIHETKDVKPEEVVTFVESLSLQQISKFRQFFETLPHLEHKFQFACIKCGYTEDIVLAGLLDFFA